MTDNITVTPSTSNVTVSTTTNAVTVSSQVPNINVTTSVQSVIVTNQQPNITISTAGVQGPAGPISNDFYAYTQAIPSSVWTITHNLNGHPTAVVFDSANNQCEGTFSYTDLNTMVITFTAAFSGTAYII